MKHTLISFCLIFWLLVGCSHNPVSSQEDSSNGYYIAMSGDTVVAEDPAPEYPVYWDTSCTYDTIVFNQYNCDSRATIFKPGNRGWWYIDIVPDSVYYLTQVPCGYEIGFLPHKAGPGNMSKDSTLYVLNKLRYKKNGWSDYE